MTHKALEELLLPYENFCTVNKGSIINFDKVRNILKNEITIKDNHVITISRRRVKEVLDTYSNYLYLKNKQ